MSKRQINKPGREAGKRKGRSLKCEEGGREKILACKDFWAIPVSVLLTVPLTAVFPSASAKRSRSGRDLTSDDFFFCLSEESKNNLSVPRFMLSLLESPVSLV